jgi:sodium-coupled monocarboxylate transporter 8/12
MDSSFSAADWAIVACYMLAVSVIGSLFYRKRSSAADYFLAGRRMRVIPVAISLVAADLSAITYMGIPAWGYQHDLELYLSVVVLIVIVPVVMYLFMPFYSRFKMYTGYEYLERRFDLKTRLVASSFFLLIRGSHVAIVIYAPSTVLSLLTGLPLWGCILAIGTFTTFYTTLGGMKAVIWTDVIQFTVLVSGVVTVLWLSLARIPGGLHTVYRVAMESGRFHMFNFSLNPRDLTSVWAMVLGGGTLVLSTMGTDQAYLQRYFATDSLRDGRKSVLLDVLILIPVDGLLFLLGTVMFVFYRFYPSHLAGLTNVDDILPFFVVRELGGLFSGLVIASIFAVSMAVMSAGINSLTTVTTIDFYHRLVQHNDPTAGTVRMGRLGTVGWGVVTTLAALFANRLGSLANAFNVINSFLGGPILGIFLLGMLSRRTKATATVVGAAAGMGSVAVVALATPLSFYYLSAVGLLATMVVGYLGSLIGERPDPAKLRGLVHGHDEVVSEAMTHLQPAAASNEPA